MRRSDLVRRGIAHHLRSYLGVLLSCLAACAVICGALLVGDSVRGSLRERALERLGSVEWSLRSERFVPERLAEALAADVALGAWVEAVVPAVILPASVVHEPSGRRSTGVRVIGVDERFAAALPDLPSWRPEGRTATINASLARDLSAKAEDSLLVRFERAGDVPREHALGERDDVAERLRVRVSSVRDDAGSAIFDLRLQQETPRNIFVPLDILQRAIERPDAVNTILLVPGAESGGAATAQVDPAAALRRCWRLADVGLRLRGDRRAGRRYVSLESGDFLLSDSIASAASLVASEEGFDRQDVLTYLVNAIRREDRMVPYSTVAAVGPWVGPGGATASVLGPEGPPAPAAGEILLVDWTDVDGAKLGASVGDRVTIEYYGVEAGDRLVERRRELRVAGVAPMTELVADPGWTPEYAGISDAETFSDWEAPFDIDLDRIRDADETFWKEHRTAPKAFLSLADGEALWGSRFGSRTSVRFRYRPDLSPEESEEALDGALRRVLGPEEFGLAFRPIRAEAIHSSRGGTDFGVLFLSLSFFLIVSALLLVAMTFRLSLQRRARELGMLRAVGFGRRTLGRIVLFEGLAVAVLGTLPGLAAGVGYAAALVVGLKTWWKDAVNAPFLALHVSPTSLAISAGTTLLLTLVSILLVVRRLAALSPRRLLSGDAESGVAAGRGAARRSRRSLRVALGLAGAGAAVSGAAGLELLPLLAGFLTVGGLLFVAGFFLLAWLLGREREGHPLRPGRLALLRLGALNARRAPGRSLLTAGLIASATFIVVTVNGSRHKRDVFRPDIDSGNGAFTLVAESAAPVYRSLSTPDGREALALRDGTRSLLGAPGVDVQALRVRPGDETSCRNLYLPARPRILGVPPAFVERGGFAWSGSLATTPAERENPWKLLDGDWPEDVVPVIGDQASVQWILHRALGDDLELVDSRGRPLRLRIVGLLRRSLFQGALLISEERFLRHFPDRDGWSMWLIATAEVPADGLTEALERDLEDYGLDVRTSEAVLAAYAAVENTYLSTFLVLGGLGLLLGTLGLGASLLRSVMERQGELGLLRALGYSRAQLGWLVVGESAFLLVYGVALGAGAAMLATAPNLLATGSRISWPLLLGTLALVLVAGLGSCFAALRSALRTPLLPALRRE